MKTPAIIVNKLKPIQDIYIPKKKYDVALKDLKRLRNDFPEYDIIDYYIGMCSVNTNDIEEAVQSFELLKNSDQLSIVQLVQVNMILGMIYTELGEHIKAESFFKTALKINPQSSMSYSALGYVYYLIKKYDLAITHFRKAIELDPNNAGAHNNLGYTYAEINLNLNEAVIECRKAVTLNAKSAVYRDSLGFAYYVSGQYGEAVAELEKALDLDSRNTIIHEHLQAAMKKRDSKR